MSITDDFVVVKAGKEQVRWRRTIPFELECIQRYNRYESIQHWASRAKWPGIGCMIAGPCLAGTGLFTGLSLGFFGAVMSQSFDPMGNGLEFAARSVTVGKSLFIVGGVIVVGSLITKTIAQAKQQRVVKHWK
jgi:hypothetical protein